MPDNLCLGISVPLLNDKTGNVNIVSNYRAITLTPVISKVLGGVIHELCEHFLVTGTSQLGFKRGIGCTDAIFRLKSVINNFFDGGRSVYATSLDISKALDKVNHCKLCMSLRAAGLPPGVLRVLCC